MPAYFLKGAAVAFSASDVTERERIHLLLIDDDRRGLADIDAGRTQEADAALVQLQQRRAGATTYNPPEKRG